MQCLELKRTNNRASWRASERSGQSVRERERKKIICISSQFDHSSGTNWNIIRQMIDLIFHWFRNDWHFFPRSLRETTTSQMWGEFVELNSTVRCIWTDIFFPHKTATAAATAVLLQRSEQQLHSSFMNHLTNWCRAFRIDLCCEWANCCYLKIRVQEKSFHLNHAIQRNAFILFFTENNFFAFLSSE